MVPFSCCCNYATVDHIGMRIFNFEVLSVVTAPMMLLLTMFPLHTLAKPICLLSHLTYVNPN